MLTLSNASDSARPSSAVEAPSRTNEKCRIPSLARGGV